MVQKVFDILLRSLCRELLDERVHLILNVSCGLGHHTLEVDYPLGLVVLAEIFEFARQLLLILFPIVEFDEIIGEAFDCTSDKWIIHHKVVENTH